MNDIIRIKDRGSFYVGGEKVKLKDVPVDEIPYMGQFTFKSDPNGSHWVKQMYVQFSILEEPKAPYPLLMWHGGGLTGVTWETTPDGREGWDTLFLRKGYDVFVSDAVERGRASWAKFPEINQTAPIFHTYEARWLNLKMGEVYPIPYEGNRFPTQCYDNLMMQSVPRWLTSDEWTIDAYSKYIERLQKTQEGVIIIAHSQGGPFAQKIAQKYPDFIKALIFIETVAVPGKEDDVNHLVNIPQLYIYGDFMNSNFKIVHPWVANVRENIPRWKETMDKLEMNYTWIDLPEIGIKGNSHMLMMDDNNDEIAEIISKWLIDKKLGPQIL